MHNTTGFTLTGFRITRELGTVRGIVVRSRSVIGKGCIIGAGCTIKNTVLLPGTIIKPGSTVVNAIVDHGIITIMEEPKEIRRER